MKIETQRLFNKNFKFMEDVLIECGDGWQGLLWGLCCSLEEFYRSKGTNSNQIEVYQIKEKYNGLRFYTNQLIDGAEEIVDRYEELSYTIDSVSGRTKS